MRRAKYFSYESFLKLHYFGTFLGLIPANQMDFSEQSIYRQVVVAESFLVMVWTTLSQLILMLSWDNEMSVGSDFTLRHINKSTWAISQIDS
jgi:hypothetical protein